MEPASTSVAVLTQAVPERPQRRTPSLELVETSAPNVRAQRLYVEAKAAAREHLALLEAALANVQTLTGAIVEAGDLYAPGIRDLATRLGEDLFWRAKTLAMLAER